MKQNQGLLFTSNIKKPPEIFLSVAQEGREGEFKKQDHIYLYIEDVFFTRAYVPKIKERFVDGQNPGEKYARYDEFC